MCFSAFASTSTEATPATFLIGKSIFATALDDDLRPGRTHTSNDLVLSFLGELTASSDELFALDRCRSVRLAVLLGHVLHLLCKFLLLGLDQELRVAHIFTLVEILMTSLEGLHHVATFVSTAGLANQLGVLHLSGLLESQMGSLLPLIIDGGRVSFHCHSLGHLLS